MKRQRMSRRHSKRSFTKTASLNRVHPRNAVPVGSPMRGGIRL